MSVHADRCLRLLVRAFFDDDACVCVGHVLTLDEPREFCEDWLVARSGLNEHRVRRVLGAWRRHGICASGRPPAHVRVCVSLRLDGHEDARGRRARRRVFDRARVALSLERTTRHVARADRLRQRWSVDASAVVRALEGRFRRIVAMARADEAEAARVDLFACDDESTAPSAPPAVDASLVERLVYESDVFRALEVALGWRAPPRDPVPAAPRAPLTPATSDGSDDEWDDVPLDDPLDEPTALVRGVPIALSEITALDRDAMTHAEFHAFCDLCERSVT